MEQNALLDLMPVDIKSFVQRKRRDLKAIALSILVYQQGLSLRKTSELLSYLGESISYRGVHYWVQKFGWCIQPYDGKLPDTIVVDETKVQLGKEYWFLYAAINPESKRIVYARIYTTRNHLTTKSFFKDLKRIYGEMPKRAVVDGGPWYTVMEKIGIKRIVISGDIRNYIERWFKSFKRRIKVFDKYFPHKEGLVKHINNWIQMFIAYHNYIRNHQNLNSYTPYQWERCFN
jgi:transposase-like protein